ncbi:MAG: SIS domain-containing protein [Anaerolineae bacterium]|jgi:glucosamine--fructose-6-phosphate aminotransferase (isomerizing)|nr:SIS domain-containing protein [Chloroflexota bacterium]
MARGAFSWQEITTQGASWQGALTAVAAREATLRPWLSQAERRGLIFIGCGSTHYLAQFAAAWFQEITGWRCRGLPSSELLLQPEAWLTPGERPAIVALSRSGDTSETIMAAETMASQGSPLLTISCYEDTGLARISDVMVAIPEGREQSFAQTRSFAGMLVGVQALGALAAGNLALLHALQALPGLARQTIQDAQALATRYGPDETIQRITYLGSGALYGLSNEATVKMKEMSLSIAEGYHFMEFRHGPMSLVDQAHLIVGLLSDRMRDYEVAVLRDLKSRGARVLAVASNDAGLQGVADDCLVVGPTLPEDARPVLFLPLVQLLAYHRSMGRGLDPDRPRNVVMAIRLSGTGMASDV